MKKELPLKYTLEQEQLDSDCAMFNDVVDYLEYLTERIERHYDAHEEVTKINGNIILRIDQRLAALEEQMEHHKHFYATQGNVRETDAPTHNPAPDQPAPTGEPKELLTCPHCQNDYAVWKGYNKDKAVCPGCGKPYKPTGEAWLVKKREALADYAHRAWVGWMCYMLPKMDSDEGGGWRTRWERLMNTPFIDLTAQERESDYKEADQILAIIDPADLRGWPPDQEKYDETLQIACDWKTKFLRSQERAERAEQRLREAVKKARKWWKKYFCRPYLDDERRNREFNEWLAEYGEKGGGE